MTRKTDSSRKANILPADALATDRLVWMTDQAFWRLARADLLDVSIYDWGHCGPCYYARRIVIRDATIGL